MAVVKFSIIFALLLILPNIYKVKSLIKFSNINCVIVDKDFGVFQKCKINAISRSKNSISINLKLWKTVSNCMMHFKLMKKASGWRPFLYNIKLDVCDFFQNPSKHLLAYNLKKVADKYNNVNHTCPYKIAEELIFDAFEIDEDSFLNKFPVDIGEYALFAKYYVGKQLVTTVNISIAYADYKKNH